MPHTFALAPEAVHKPGKVLAICRTQRGYVILLHYLSTELEAKTISEITSDLEFLIENE